jgi:hypothetical protein
MSDIIMEWAIIKLQGFQREITLGAVQLDLGAFSVRWAKRYASNQCTGSRALPGKLSRHLRTSAISERTDGIHIVK